MYVRSLMDHFYVEHGDHYAIGALGVILMVTIQYQIEKVITGLVGVLLIGWSF